MEKNSPKIDKKRGTFVPSMTAGVIAHIEKNECVRYHAIMAEN